MNMTLIYLIILELTLFYWPMILIILFLVYFHYMLSEVRLELCSCIGSYSSYSLDRWVSCKYYVGLVLRPYLSMITPYSLELEDHGSDSPIESFVFLLSIIRIIEHHYYSEVLAMFMIYLANITMHRYNLF